MGSAWCSDCNICSVMQRVGNSGVTAVFLSGLCCWWVVQQLGQGVSAAAHQCGAAGTSFCAAEPSSQLTTGTRSMLLRSRSPMCCAMLCCPVSWCPCHAALCCAVSLQVPLRTGTQQRVWARSSWQTWSGITSSSCSGAATLRTWRATNGSLHCWTGRYVEASGCMQRHHGCVQVCSLYQHPAGPLNAVGAAVCAFSGGGLFLQGHRPASLVHWCNCMLLAHTCPLLHHLPGICGEFARPAAAGSAVGLARTEHELACNPASSVIRTLSAPTTLVARQHARLRHLVSALH
jgi:hypothetical protein